MFALKLFLGISCVFACVKLSNLKAKNIKEELYYYSSVCISCDSLISGLSYSKQTVKELLNVDYPSETFVLTVRSYFDEKELVFPSFITTEEEITLNNYFNLLGKSNSTAQKTAILSYKDVFLKLQDEKKKKYDKSYSAIIKVGFSLGVMLFILVI